MILGSKLLHLLAETLKTSPPLEMDFNSEFERYFMDYLKQCVKGGDYIQAHRVEQLLQAYKQANKRNSTREFDPKFFPCTYPQLFNILGGLLEDKEKHRRFQNTLEELLSDAEITIKKEIVKLESR